MTAPTRPSSGTCAPLTAEGRVPLVALFSRCEALFVAEFDRRLKDSEFCSLSLAHSRNVLRHLGNGPRRASNVVEQCDVSKQAISQQIAHLERNGYVAVELDPSDARARLLQLTPKGRKAQRLVTQLFADIEADWAQQLGGSGLEEVRTLLSNLLSHDAGCDPQLQVECSTLP